MLDYQKDRVDYGEALKPPEGYHLKRAIGATFSLDLHALLCIPVALFYSKNLDSKVSDNRLDILDAIQKTAESVTVYCQKGRIQVPKGHYKILSFIEDSVREVLPDQPIASFHPKTWIIRFEAEGKPTLYRVMVLSRNLTFDRSWDIAMYIEGFVGTEKQAKATSLVDYTNYLNSKSPFVGYEEFVSDLSKVSFYSGDDLLDFDFYPIGIRGHNHPLPKRFNRSLIVSPFLHEEALKSFYKTSYKPRYLFSRREELDKIGLDTLSKFETYCLTDSVVDGEQSFEEESESEKMQQNLHAKLYIGADKNGYHWYMGSANCTKAAQESNTEFLMHLHWKGRKKGVNHIAKLLETDGKVNYFERYQRAISEPAESQEYDFRSEIHSLLLAINSGEFVWADLNEITEVEKTYSVKLSFSTFPKEIDQNKIKLKCSLMGESLKEIPENGHLNYSSVHLNKLSPFIHWCIENKSTKESKEFISKLDLDLPEQRLNSIFKSIIDSSDKFFLFLQFLLGNGDSTLDFIEGSGNTKSSNGSGLLWQDDTPILEDLMVAASRNPDKLRDIERIISRLNEAGEESPVPLEFNDFWGTFKSFIQDD